MAKEGIVLKGVIHALKKKILEIWYFKRLWVYIGLSAAIGLFILSFFIDIGYIFAIGAVLGLLYFSKRVSQEDPDVLKIEENKKKKEEQQYLSFIQALQVELIEIESYIEENPTDFAAWKRKAEIEEFLNEKNNE